MSWSRRWRRATRPAARPSAAVPVDRGSATVELALALPVLAILVFAAISAVGAVHTQLACTDSAREAALVAARGGDGVQAGARVAPTGATVRVSRGGDTVQATVSVRFHPLGGRLPSILIEATSVAAAEPDGLP